jgi:hypothetical protein
MYSTLEFTKAENDKQSLVKYREGIDSFYFFVNNF